MIHHAGLRIKIIQDENSESPEYWGHEEIFLVGFHRQFYVTRPKSGLGKPEDVESWMERESANFHVFKLSAYIHGGVALSLGSDFACDPGGWDTSMLGFVFVQRESWKEEAKAREAAQSLVDEWNMYLSGDVWGYVVEDQHGTHLESCWGFYGQENCLEEAKGIAEACAKNLREEDVKIQRAMAL